MSRSAVRVGDLLVDAGVITRAQLGEALRHQAAIGGRLGTNLIELGFLDERTLAGFLAKQLSIPSVTAAQIDRIPQTVLKLLSRGTAGRLRAVPVREDAGRLWVAMSDPTDGNALAELGQETGKPVRPMVAPELLMAYALEKHYGVKRTLRVVEVRTSSSGLLRIEDVEDVEPEKPPAAPAFQPPPIGVEQVAMLTGYLDDSPPPASAFVAPPARLTLQTVVDELLRATADEQVLDLAARFLAQDVPRVWVLVLRQGELIGYLGRGVDPAYAQGMRTPLAQLPLVAQALSGGEAMAGRFAPEQLGRLAAPLGVWGETLGMLLPVRLGKQAVAVIIGVDATLEAMRRKPELDKLVQKLDHALHINYLRRMLQQP